MNDSDRFYDLMQNLALAADHCSRSLSQPVQQASDLIFESLSNGAKVLVCGQDSGHLIAQQFAAQMINGFERQRLPLSVHLLTHFSATVIESNSIHDTVARQVQAYGHTGDVLVCIGGIHNQNLVTAVERAHERDMHVIALLQTDDVLLQAMHDFDVCLLIPAEQPHIVRLLQSALINALCDAVDTHLLGMPE